MSDHMSVITDWRVRDDDLPDILPGEEFEHVITPQKHVVLCRIVVGGLHLVRLVIGIIEIPFKLEAFANPFKLEAYDNNDLRTYRPTAPKQLTIRRTKADEIAVVAGQDVRVVLRNEGDEPAKPRAALLVREEVI